jgi:hypothetical protein
MALRYNYFVTSLNIKPQELAVQEWNMDYKKILSVSFLVILIVTCISGCSQTTKTPEVEPTIDGAALCSVSSEPNQPELYGLWVKGADDQRELLTITASCVYLVERTDLENDNVLSESFYEVQSVDWVNGVVTMKLDWLRVDGLGTEVINPIKLMKVYIDNNSLYFDINDEAQGVPGDTTDGPWVKQ